MDAFAKIYLNQMQDGGGGGGQQSPERRSRSQRQLERANTLRSGSWQPPVDAMGLPVTGGGFQSPSPVPRRTCSFRANRRKQSWERRVQSTTDEPVVNANTLAIKSMFRLLVSSSFL